jgi:LemA protein
MKKTILVISFLLMTGCGIQSIPTAKNAVDASLAEITNQYQRRADLIPNLVATVKGYAKQEETVLTNVIKARAEATQVKLQPSDIESVKKYQAAQGELSQALGRLMVVTENYPQLKSDANFRELQAQLEGTENRITVARRRHIDNIQAFNNLITVPPTNLTNMLFYHNEKLPQWTVDNVKQIEKAPTVNF